MVHVLRHVMAVAVPVKDVVEHVSVSVRINVVKVAVRVVRAAVMVNVKADVGNHVLDLPLRNMIHVKNHVPVHVQDVVVLQPAGPVSDVVQVVRVDVYPRVLVIVKDQRPIVIMRLGYIRPAATNVRIHVQLYVVNHHLIPAVVVHQHTQQAAIIIIMRPVDVVSVVRRSVQVHAVKDVLTIVPDVHRSVRVRAVLQMRI